MKIHICCKNWKTVFNRKLPVLQDELLCVLRNIFRRCEAYLEAGGQHFDSSMKQVELQREDGLWIPGQCGHPVCVCVYGSSHDTCLAQGCDLWDHLYYRWRIDVEERSLIVLNNKFYILERSGKPWQESSWDKCHGCGFIVVWQCKAGASAQNQSCLINWYEQFSCVGPVESLCSWLCFPLFMKYKNALSSSLSVLVLGVCPWLFPQFSL